MSDDERQVEASFGKPYLLVGPGESDNSRFGELLERLRSKAGLSRADAAAKLGFSSEYLRLIELGKRTPALGQMRNILAAYGADGDIETVRRPGSRQDLLLFDPLEGFGGDLVAVEFKSRIREARRRARGGPPDEGDWQQDSDQQTRIYDSPSASRAAELGAVVSLLTRADDSTLRRIRELLEDAIDE